MANSYSIPSFLRFINRNAFVQKTSSIFLQTQCDSSSITQIIIQNKSTRYRYISINCNTIYPAYHHTLVISNTKRLNKYSRIHRIHRTYK